MFSNPLIALLVIFVEALLMSYLATSLVSDKFNWTLAVVAVLLVTYLNPTKILFPKETTSNLVFFLLIGSTFVWLASIFFVPFWLAALIETTLVGATFYFSKNKIRKQR